MNIIISSLLLIFLFLLYKYTYFFNKKQHRIFQYLLIVVLASLALLDMVIGNMILKDTGFSAIVGLNFGLGLLIFFASLKIMTIYHKLDDMK